MADRIQLDGKTYMPLMEAAAMAAVSEKQVMTLAQSGRVFLRAIGKKVYVDIDGLQAEKNKELGIKNEELGIKIVPTIPTMVPIAEPLAQPHIVAPVQASVPIQATTSEATTASSRAPLEDLEDVAPIVRAAAAPMPPVHFPTHHLSSAELSAISPKEAEVMPPVPHAQSQPQAQPTPLPRIVLPPKQFGTGTGRSFATSVAALAAFVFVIGGGIAAYENSPALARLVGNVGEQVAAVVNFGNTATYQATPGTLGNSPLENSPSELQASTQASTIPVAVASSSQPIYYVYNYPVIERVVQEVRYIQADSPEDFATQLNDLYERIQTQIRGLNITTNTQFAQQYQVIAQTNNIDKLGSVTITDSIFTGGTITGATITGGSVTATAFNGILGISTGGTGTSTAPSYGQLLLGNAAGGYDYIATSSLGLATGSILGDSNTWSALQLFSLASTSQLSVFNKAYFGGSATTTIDSAGNIVGAGTLSAGTTTLANLMVTNLSTSTFAGGLTVGTSQFIVQQSTGNIGIGTTDADSRLTVKATDDSSPAILIKRYDNETGYHVGIGEGYDGSNGGGVMNFYTSQGDGVSAFKMVVGTNVGIGTTTPFRKLSVTAAVATAQAALSYDTTRNTDFLTDSAGDLTINPSGDDVRLNDDNLWVCSGGSCPSGTPSGTGKLVVETALGVGTSTPIWPLTASHATLPQLSLTDASATSDAWTFRNVGNTLYIATSTASATSTTPALTITPNGFVGIGTSSPSQQLSASGLLFVGANGAAGMGTATSTFYGDIKIIGKLDVSTIDPVYTIDGIKYATYGHSTVGIKEEVTLKITPPVWNAEKRMYAYVIDFDSLEKGSDLWLFYQVTDFGKQWQSLVTSLTPSFDGRVYYEEDIEGNTLTVYASESALISVRLIASRFDFSKWANLRPDQDGDTAGTHVIPGKQELRSKNGE